MMNHWISYVFVLFSAISLAQEKDKFVPKGNDAFAEKKYADAEADYRVSHSKSPQYAVSSYNLGNSIYRQNEIAEAKAPFLKSIENAKTRPQKHLAFHNLGNVYMKEKKYTEAVEAYKNALRNDPKDEQTRYNFALAKKMLKENPPPKKDDKKKDDKKKDDKKKKDEKKDDKKNQDQDKKDDKKDGDKDKKNEGNDDKPQQPKPQPGDIPKERLQNLLDAVNNEEKKIQEKVNAKKTKPHTVKTEKDW